MLKNYLKIAYRNFRKHKLYSFINIIGLSVGIACCILIYLFVRFEGSFDEFHAKSDRIYMLNRITYQSAEASARKTSVFDTRAPEGVSKVPYMPLPLGPALLERFPEVERITHFDDSQVLLRNGETVSEESIAYTNSEFFDVFDFPLLLGNPETVLDDRRNMVITPEIARKYFGNQNPVGKTILVRLQDEERPFTVTGVVQAPPVHSSLQFGVLLRLENRPYYERQIDQWRSYNTPIFVELREGSDPTAFKGKLDAFVNERYAESMQATRARLNMPEEAKVMEFGVVPLENLHLDASTRWEGASNPLYSYILTGIAILILLIACINYITLALARSSRRAKEVGIRKATGAGRRQIAVQFWGETQLLTIMALVAGLGLAELFLPFFNDLANTGLSITLARDTGFLGILLGIGLLAGGIAGGYPALVLSGYKPAVVLKDHTTHKIKPRFTKILLVFQYGLSVFLIISSIIMYRQLDFVGSKDLGYDKEQVVGIPTHTGWNEQGTDLMNRFRDRVNQLPGVTGVSGMTPAFTKGFNQFGFSVNEDFKSAFVYFIGSGFLDMMGLEIVEGRDFSPDRPGDLKNSIIVNQALVESVGWEDPVGQELFWNSDEVSSTVIGVVKDFHFQSLEVPIEPMLFYMDPESGGVGEVLVKIREGDIAETLPALEAAWNDVAPFTPFDYWFLDDAVSAQYESYRKWMNIMFYAAALAIFIACMGLFGLAGITAVNRTKEIGIRKVLGAGVNHIIVLLNKDIVRLVGLSLVIAAPVSWYIMSRWLEDFSYRIEIGPGIFIGAGIAAMAIALLTVSYHSIKASGLNPVDSIRTE